MPKITKHILPKSVGETLRDAYNDIAANLTDEEKEGVKMIQALLAFNGQSEPKLKSLTYWRSMHLSEKVQTVWAYEFFIKSKEQADGN